MRPILFTCHACRSPLGRDPYKLVVSFPGAPWLWRTLPPHAHPMHGPSMTLTSPLLSAGMWLGNHLFRLSFTVWVAEVRGLHAPRLDAAPPRLPSPASSLRLWPVLPASHWTQPLGPHHDFGQRPSPKAGRYICDSSRCLQGFPWVRSLESGKIGSQRTPPSLEWERQSWTQFTVNPPPPPFFGFIQQGRGQFKSLGEPPCLMDYTVGWGGEARYLRLEHCRKRC